MSLAAGTRLGVYVIAAPIGQGGMGEVYRARDTKLDRDVALKVLPEAFTSDPDRLARFEREAKLLASLNHPNIAAIHGLEDSGDTPALVLELVEGPTLADRIARGPIPVDEALPIARQIAEALEAAHESGVIHRDLKPANIKVREDGTVKVLDFGLAKAMAGEQIDQDLSQSPTVTATMGGTRDGVILGTAAYMSPEQARGKPVDKRTDIWAFGCVLYEMLTGQAAFAGETLSDTIGRVMEREPEWDGLPPSLPAGVAIYLRRCLTKDARERVRDAGDVGLALAGRFEILGEDREQSKATGDNGVAPAWRRASTVATGALALIGAVVLGLWVANGADDENTREVMRFEMAPDDLSLDGSRKSVGISPDGSQFVYKVRTLNGTRLVLRPIGTLEGREADPIGDNGPFFSPDGEWFGFTSGTGFIGGTGFELFKVPSGGGALERLVSLAGFPLGVSWGADDQIVIGSDAGLFGLPAAGGEPELLTTLEAGRNEVTHAWPFVIPDSDAVLFSITTGVALSTAELAVLSRDTGVVKRLGLSGLSPFLLPTGHLVYVTGDGLVAAIGFNPSTLEVLGTPATVIEGVSMRPTGAAQFSVSTTGRVIYGVDDPVRNTLVWVDREGNEEPIAAPPRAYSSAIVSPDGSRLALGIMDQRWDIWVWDLARERLTRVTRDAAEDEYGHWTPDGQRVLFTSTREGRRALYAAAADGTGDFERIAQAERGVSGFTPDRSQLIANVSVPGRGQDLLLVSLADGHETEVLLSTEFTENGGVVSPDGRWLAYQSVSSGQREVYVLPFPDLDSAPRQLVSDGGGGSPLWSLDGAELYYASENSRLHAVPVETGETFSAGRPEVILEGYRLRSGSRTYDLGPDGRFLMIKPDPDALATLAPGRLVVIDNWFKELNERVPLN